MITAVSKAITNPLLVNIAQSADASVTAKTVVNSIGRPGFILIDNNIDDETKKFAATKEFLYQAASLAVYIALIVKIKKWAFQIAKNHVFKGEEGFSKFKDMKEYIQYHKLAEKSVQNRTASLSKDNYIHKFNHDGLREDLLNNERPEKYNKIKGSIELGSLVGSVLGLSIIAPNVSQALIHPVLRFLGMEKKEETKPQIDTKA